MFFVNQPLIVDLTRLLPGPYGTFLLAQFGARVVKIEDKGKGDYLKSLFPEREGEDAYIYRLLNSCKEIRYLDLKQAVDREEFLQLVKEADLLIESFRPGVMERLGLGYDFLQTLNPRLAYITIGGYQPDSPWAKDAGHDLNYQAVGGSIGSTGKQERAIPGLLLGDLAGGMALFAVAAAALYKQAVSGQGGRYTIGIAEVVQSWANVTGAFYGQDKRRYPLPGQGVVAGGIVCYNLYRCLDGYVVLAALEEKFWANFCRATGKEHWLSQQFAPALPGQPVYEEVSQYFARRRREEILAELGDKDCCLSPVLELKELVPDSETEHRERITAFVR
ncbi:MAG: CoA transferase [Bacillota bacterium]